MEKQTKFTPFEADIAAQYGGGKKFPEVFYNGRKIPYFKYQLATHKFQLSLMSKGISTGNKLRDYKKYYGLKGNTTEKVFQDFIERIWNKYSKDA